ncbi:GntR family transcriptional regulator [Streptomyces sp. NPDC029006]|uniref:GntR family transcriptional regulator n=1 Tax=Streptomyces sp. NPDC029006 TaxID=3155467 RepID=UPI0033E0D398
MTQQASPRGTFLKVADAVRTLIEGNPGMTELPSLPEVMREHGVSRGVAIRAYNVLRQEGLAQPSPGARWRIVRADAQVDQRPLHERIVEVIATDGLQAGEEFPSASSLAKRFGASRPTVTKALEKLEAAGVLMGGGQGRVRTVRAAPTREEHS